VLALYVGSFAGYQGLDLLFEAMRRVFQARPEVRLVIIGGSEAEREARRAWLARHGVADRVTFLGFVAPDALPEYLRAADILLSPRISGNNSPLKLLDYLKSTRPIVATDLPANRELVDDSCALLVPPDAAAFAAGVERLASAPALRDSLGRAGRRRIDDTYNLDGFVKRLRACYAGLPAHPPAARRACAPG
jgi:glycosyltransferase involved in cell wall biosynthesis